MLTEKEARPRASRNLRRQRRLWHRPDCPQAPLGCQSCPELKVCGELRIDDRIFDCLSLCCRRPERCTSVCRNNPDFADRVREIGGFDLADVPRVERCQSPVLPPVVPVVFHVSRLEGPIRETIVALPLYELLSRHDASRYESPEALRSAFKLMPRSRIVLTGTATDAPLERWWGMETAGRVAAIRSLRRCGVDLVTTPNFSLFSNAPRWNDLHAMKRIAIVHYEFLSEGQAVALHVNARTETDFDRWSEYIGTRPEVTDIAFEFTTGSRYRERRLQHVEWLKRLASRVDRSLNLIIRGGVDVISDLCPSYSRVTVLATTAFMKTIQRQRGALEDDGSLRWESSPTLPGEPLDELLASNMAAEARAIHGHSQPRRSAEAS